MGQSRAHRRTRSRGIPQLRRDALIKTRVGVGQCTWCVLFKQTAGVILADDDDENADTCTRAQPRDCHIEVIRNVPQLL